MTKAINRKYLGNAFIGLSVLSLFISSTYLLPKSFDLAQTLGNLVGVLAVCYLIAKFFIRNKGEAAQDSLILLIGVISVIWSLGVIYSNYSSKQNVIKLVDEVARGDVVASESSAVGLPVKVPGYSGSANESTQILLSVAIQSAKPYLIEFQKYGEALDKLPLDKVLSQDIFKSREALDSSKNIINKAEFYLNEQSRIQSEISKAQIKAIEEADVDKSFKDAFMRGYLESNKKTIYLQNSQIEESKKIMMSARKIIDLAEKNIGKVQFIGNSITFPSQRDSDIYNEQIAIMSKAAQEEERLRNEYAKFRESSVNNMKAIVQ